MKVDLKHFVISINDGGSNTVEVKVGDGTLTWTEKRNIEYVKDRGILDGTREGDQEPIDVRLDIIWEELRGSTATPYEAITKTGSASSWVSSSADLCEPYAVDIEAVHTPPCAGNPAETILISDFRYESIDADPRTGMLTVSGKANVTRPTITNGS